MSSPSSCKSKTIATWLALLGGSLGWHRLYLRGLGDAWAWLHVVPTALGAYGAWRMSSLGQDDQWAWVLIPVLGLMLSGTQLLAIVYGLMPDDKWNARFNARAAAPMPASGWLAVLGACAALMVGASILMATLAFAMQRSAEYTLLAEPARQQTLP
jgi:hypothetical protein